MMFLMNINEEICYSPKVILLGRMNFNGHQKQNTISLSFVFNELLDSAFVNISFQIVV